MNFGGLFGPNDHQKPQVSAVNSLGAIPVLNRVTSATRGATDAFSGFGRHINDSLRKLGANRTEAGIGLDVKPGVVHQIQSCLVESMTKMMLKFGIAPNISLKGVLPASLQSGMSMITEPSNKNPMENILQLATKLPDPTSRSLPKDGNMNAGSIYETLSSKSPQVDSSYESRMEKVISSFLHNPILKDGDNEENDMAQRLLSESNMLQMVLKHQQVIKELLEENEKLRQVLVEDLNIPPSKLQATRDRSPFTDDFECSRKQSK